ncbi:hypothetical protein HGRIS_012423 [Hohenbuehelia grisea]|uniref:Fungal-type protein kinase domain-containing protein n=1 Tax=Hohenbuehelia grisea TaxID=104357 RepID=A0ABR3IS68_9AGAR
MYEPPSDDTPRIYEATATIRTALKEELTGKVLEDSDAVKGRLGYHRVAKWVVQACLETLKLPVNQTAIDELKFLARQATQKTNKHKDERSMYPELSVVFDAISSHAKGGLFNRRWTSNSNRATKAVGIEGLPTIYPDFVLGTFAPNDVVSWDRCDAIGEIKADAADGISKSNKVSDVLAQCADYARLHMAGRPFQLYSVGLMITGDLFRVAIFDRDGVVVTQAWNMWDNLECFIRFIFQLATAATPAQLGEDPSARPLYLPPHNPLRDEILKQTRSLGVPDTLLDYPAYRVSCFHSPTTIEPWRATNPRSSDTIATEWVTIGPPIWVSISLLGRGTSIWRVMRISASESKFVDPTEICILKNAWRSNRRDSESLIYGTVEPETAGVARFLVGGDVHFVGSTAAISVYNLRSKSLWGPIDAPSYSGLRTSQELDFRNFDQPTSILHRLVLKTQGRPLWEFRDYLELLLGFRAALVGHQGLWSQGILHRDISAGNIMLSASPTPQAGEEGFLMDLEYCHLRHLIERKYGDDGEKNPTVRVALKWMETQRGGIMTGTVQFMAVEKLSLILGERRDNLPNEHKVFHDLESFIWVFAYAVIRHLMSEPRFNSSTKTKKDIEEWFKQSFCRLTLSEVKIHRENLTPFIIPDSVNKLVRNEPRLLPESIRDFFQGMYETRIPENRPSRVVGANTERVARAFGSNRNAVRRLTHDLLLQDVDTTISWLRDEMADW